MNIFESIAAVMQDIGSVGKNSKNQQQGFMFRGIDAVMNALAPALIKNKVFIVPEVLEQIREDRQTAKGGNLIYSVCKIKYTFYAEDGTNISAVVIGEGMDSGDKATNKAMSIAFKYACFQTFCIPTEEMVDPDAECHEVKGKKASAKPEPKPEQKPEKKSSGKDSKPNPPDEVEFKNDVTEADCALLRSMFAQKGIKEEYVLKLYNRQALEDITINVYDNIMRNLDKIKAKQEEDK